MRLLYDDYLPQDWLNRQDDPECWQKIRNISNAGPLINPPYNRQSRRSKETNVEFQLCGIYLYIKERGIKENKRGCMMKKKIIFAFFGMVIFVLAGCATQYDHQGYYPDDYYNDYPNLYYHQAPPYGYP